MCLRWPGVKCCCSEKWGVVALTKCFSFYYKIQTCAWSDWNKVQKKQHNRGVTMKKKRKLSTAHNMEGKTDEWIWNLYTQISSHVIWTSRAITTDIIWIMREFIKKAIILALSVVLVMVWCLRSATSQALRPCAVDHFCQWQVNHEFLHLSPNVPMPATFSL